MSDHRYVVVVSSKEAKSASKGNPVITEEGEKFLVLKEPEGWVEATSIQWSGTVNSDALTFNDVISAEKFAKRWKGHPWWCKPNGDYEIIEISARIVKRQEGWNVVQGKAFK